VELTSELKHVANRAFEKEADARELSVRYERSQVAMEKVEGACVSHDPSCQTYIVQGGFKYIVFAMSSARPESEYIVFVYVFAVTFNEVRINVCDFRFFRNLTSKPHLETSPTACQVCFDHDEIVIRIVRYPLHNVVVPRYYGPGKCTTYDYCLCIRFLGQIKTSSSLCLRLPSKYNVFVFDN